MLLLPPTNGKLHRPVILIAAGLRTTAKAFGSLGISRFSGNCFVELGALSKEAERSVIHDWLTKDGGAKGDPTKWIDTIAKETHGWPQHILSYVEPAARYLQDNDGVMNTDGLSTILDVGKGLRAAYYKHRMDDFTRKQCHSLAKLIAGVPLEEGLDKEDIIASLTQDYGELEAKKMFDRVLHGSILYKRNGVYAIPIPSMQNWLVSNYAHIQIKPLPQEQETHRFGSKNLDQGLER